MNESKLLVTISYTYSYLLLQKDRRHKGLLSTIGPFCSFSRQQVYRVLLGANSDSPAQTVTHCYRATVNKSEITLIDKEVVVYLNCWSAQRYNYPHVALIYFLESWRKSSTKALFCMFCIVLMFDICIGLSSKFGKAKVTLSGSKATQ